MFRKAPRTSENPTAGFKPHYVVRSIESERVPRPTTGDPKTDREWSDQFVKRIIAILDERPVLEEPSSWSRTLISRP